MFEKLKKLLAPELYHKPEPVAPEPKPKKPRKSKQPKPSVELTAKGYKIKSTDTDNEIVDRWFQTVCRNVALEVYEQEAADPEKRESDLRIIQQRDLGGGYTEIS